QSGRARGPSAGSPLQGVQQHALRWRCQWLLTSSPCWHTLSRRRLLRHLLSQETRERCVKRATQRHMRLSTLAHSHADLPEAGTAPVARRVHTSVQYPRRERAYATCLYRRPSRDYRRNVPGSGDTGIRQRTATGQLVKRYQVLVLPASAASQASNWHGIALPFGRGSPLHRAARVALSLHDEDVYLPR